ncbi:transcription intermediary factor 1-alpha-like [Gambusia affinis]|uniref:transcription intermediary factor 1-alpha-like n=1 Tax=Gambusia affinis TaxID=33528 RepID=UPI001CDCBD13|nr:transcription intermediary factor 1-alpha-like [Gambusia affinis]
MAALTKGGHGNFPQRRVAPLPGGVGCREPPTPETGPRLVTAAEEPVPAMENFTISGLGQLENWSRTGKNRASSSGKRETQAYKSVKDLLKTMRIHPEAQRILGNSAIPVVNLERLNFQRVASSSLQPVVSLVRLPLQADVVPLNGPQQNGFSPTQEDILEVNEGPTQSEECQVETMSACWTEPYCPDGSPYGEPEQDSGFDCESNPDQPYILLDSESDDGRSETETFYLDPDAEQAVVMELDPEAEANRDLCLQLEDDPDVKCEVDVLETELSEDGGTDLCCLTKLESESGAGTEQTEESEDFCAVCMNGGELLCCDRCPKVYHLDCHLPSLISFPVGDWVCTLCRTDKDPVENTHPCGAVRVPYTLSDQDQRRCEKLSLMLYCHPLSVPFHDPVSPLARNYYQIIKRPIDLSVIRRKLDKCNTLHYFTAEQFVDDILLMFKNCATFNYPDSEVAQAGRTLEVVFLSSLKEVFPERTFPSASQDRMNKARNRWLSRKRRHVFSGRKFYL